MCAKVQACIRKGLFPVYVDRILLNDLWKKEIYGYLLRIQKQITGYY